MDSDLPNCSAELTEEVAMFRTPFARAALLALALAALLAGCITIPSNAPLADEPISLTVASHDSFSVSEEVVAAFEQANNVDVRFLALGDAGEALNKMILSKGAPLADVFFGVDNTYLSRALEEEVFAPYTSPLLDQVPDGLELDPSHALTPVDFGYVTLNADAAWFEQQGLPLPAALEDLTRPEYAGLLVVQNPATSSPGLAFLLATVAHFGEDGYLDFWRALAANDLLVTSGWTEAYYEQFTVGSGGTGTRPLVVSYTTSPPADVVFATDGRTEPASVNLNLPGGVFRQVEFVGVVNGAAQPELAQRWIDFMLGEQFQADIPLQMYVYPANENVPLPDLFTQFAPPPEPALVASALDPAAIQAGREQWIADWTEAVLRQ
jgi:thiamine transport system substrate-binding protein